MQSPGLRILFLFASLICANVATQNATAQNIDSLVQQRVVTHETPGIVVGVYAEGKATYYAHGFANLTTREEATSTTLFEIGSITKTFTTLMAAMMIEKGMWSWQDPIQKFLPVEVRVPEKNGKPITIENLATARSGLPRMPDNFSPADPQNPFVDYTQKQLVEFLNHYSLPRDPGAAYEYSNLGMGLLGYTVARLNHTTYRQLVEKWVLQPLHMDHTTILQPGSQLQHLAQGYVDSVAVKNWSWSDQSVLEGAGALVSNAEDMMIYLIANLRKTSALGPAMAATHTPRFDAGSLRMQIGLGWHILNNKIVWHNGGTGGFRTFAGFDPNSNTAVVVLTNSTTGADDLGFYLLDNSQPLKNIHRTIKVDEKILMKYTGEYEITPEFKLSVSYEKGSLFIQATGQNKFELSPESELKFYVKEPNAEVEFICHENGVVEKLVLRQNGAAHDAIKIK